MLNYGAAAQDFFDDYGINDLANAWLTDEQKTYATIEAITATDIRVKDDNCIGSNLNFGSNLTMSMFFKNITTDMYAIVTFTDYRGRAQEIRIDGSAFEKYNSTTYRIYISAAVVADVSQSITCKVYSANGTEVITSCVDSIESVVARSTDDTVYSTLMKFAYATRTYLLERGY